MPVDKSIQSSNRPPKRASATSRFPPWSCIVVSLDERQQHKKRRDARHRADIEPQALRDISSVRITRAFVQPWLIGKFAVIEARPAQPHSKAACHRGFRPAGIDRTVFSRIAKHAGERIPWADADQ